MNFNGWQRLWVVLVVLSAFPVVIADYELWPTAAIMSSADADPFKLLSPYAARDLDWLAQFRALPAVGSEVMEEPPVVDVEDQVLRWVRLFCIRR